MNLRLVFSAFTLVTASSSMAATLTFDGTVTDADPSVWNDVDNYLNGGSPHGALPTLADDVELDQTKINDGAVYGEDLFMNSLKVTGTGNAIGGPAGGTNGGTNDIVDSAGANSITFGSGLNVGGTNYHVVYSVQGPANNTGIRGSLHLASPGEFRILSEAGANEGLILSSNSTRTNITKWMVNNENTNVQVRIAHGIGSGIDLDANGWVETNNATGFGNNNSITTASLRDTELRMISDNSSINRNHSLVLGTGFETELRRQWGTSGATGTLNWNLNGVISGGAAGVDLVLNPRAQQSGVDPVVVNTITLTNANTYLSRTVVRSNVVSGVRGQTILTGSLAHANMLVEGNGVFTGTGSLTWNVDGLTSGLFDFADINGLWEIAGLTADFDLTIGQPGTDTDLILADYSGGTLAGGAFNSVTGLPSWAALDYNFNGNDQIALVLSAVPEPTRATLLLLGLSGLLLRRRR